MYRDREKYTLAKAVISLIDKRFETIQHRP